MRFSQAWIIAQHDLDLIRRRISIIGTLIGFPLGVAVGFPLVLHFIFSSGATPPGSAAGYAPFLDAFGFWFVIAAGTLPVTIASYSIVGEKVEKSLEPLLSTPTTDGEILLGKTLAAFLPTLVAIWLAAALYMGLMDVVTQSASGISVYPNWEMIVISLADAPLAGLIAIEASILVSARVNDVRSAQQIAGMFFFPFIVLYVASEIGAFVLNTLHLLELAGALSVLALGLFVLTRQTFRREEILTRWK